MVAHWLIVAQMVAKVAHYPETIFEVDHWLMVAQMVAKVAHYPVTIFRAAKVAHYPGTIFEVAHWLMVAQMVPGISPAAGELRQELEGGWQCGGWSPS